jgi:hypothetical protein
VPRDVTAGARDLLDEVERTPLEVVPLDRAPLALGLQLLLRDARVAQARDLALQLLELLGQAAVDLRGGLQLSLDRPLEVGERVVAVLARELPEQIAARVAQLLLDLLLELVLDRRRPIAAEALRDHLGKL